MADKSPLAEFLVKRRQELNGMSQKELSENTGVSLGTIASIESGQSKLPRKNTLAELAKGLDTDFEQLWALCTEMPREKYLGIELPDVRDTKKEVRNLIRSLIFSHNVPHEVADSIRVLMEGITAKYNPNYPEANKSQDIQTDETGRWITDSPEKLKYLKELDEWTYDQ